MTLLRRIPVPGTGPEDVVTDNDGTLYTGLDDGSILAVDVETASVRPVAHTGGRPLGLHRLPDGSLLVCDAQRGLLRMDPGSGHMETLLTEVRGERLTFCSNAATAADGTTYVSDSSRRFGLDHWKGDLLEHSGTGRLVRLSPGRNPRSFWTACSSPTASPWPPTAASWPSRNQAATACDESISPVRAPDRPIR